MSTLYLVSAGPGNPELVTPASINALDASTDVVAYGLYLELLGPAVALPPLWLLTLGKATLPLRRCLTSLSRGFRSCVLVLPSERSDGTLGTLVAANAGGQTTPLV